MKPRRVLFLDMDGVVNSAAWFKSTSKRQYRRARGRAKAQVRADARLTRMIDPEAVKHLNAILRAAAPVDVVLSSSWRLAYSLAEVQAAMRAKGFTGKIVGKTPSLLREGIASGREGIVIGVERGHEIAAWLADHQVEAFAILDDGGDMAHLCHALVRTPWATGLGAEHVAPTVALLTGTRV